MNTEKLVINGIPALLWGKPSNRVYIHVHGKMSRKEYAEDFAVIADEKGFQTLSFDLPEHGEHTTDPAYRCDVWNGMRDLGFIADYAFSHWKHVSLFACSLGAYFALNAYAGRSFEKCLFQSPIVDMRWLVEHMMLWSGVSEEQLKREREIVTQIDTLRWDYYQYILSHPIEQWPHPTSVLYAALDDLQPIDSLQTFCSNFDAALMISEHSKHPFMEPADRVIVQNWLREHI